MAHSILRSNASRLSTFGLALTALMGLTAAKGGCGNTVIEEPLPQPAPSKCQAGFHAEKQCSSGYSVSAGSGCAASPDDLNGYCDEPPPPSNEVCEDVCVPDPCPEGTEWLPVCVGGGTTVAATSSGSGEPQAQPSQPPADCHYECVPVSKCPSGTHEETVCYDYDCGPGGDCGGGCDVQCVPDHDCNGPYGSSTSVGSSGSTGSGG